MSKLNGAMLLIILILVAILIYQNRYKLLPTEEVWLTAPMERDGDYVYVEDINLVRINKDGNLYHYYSRGEYVILGNVEYKDGRTQWKITDEVKQKFPNWETNEDWGVDFLYKVVHYPIIGVRYPGNSEEGTMSK